MRRFGVSLTSAAVLIAVLISPIQAQEGRLQLTALDRFGSQAVETVDVTVDEQLLKLASKFLSPKRSPDEATIKELVEGLKGVYVKRFVFEREGVYSESDIEAVRNQLRSPGWSRIVGVRSKKGGNNVDVFIMNTANLIKGLAVLVADPKELTVVNVVGPIDLEKLSRLEGQFGIPRLGLERGKDDETENKPRTERKPN